jgi:hypothetical protein
MVANATLRQGGTTSFKHKGSWVLRAFMARRSAGADGAKFSISAATPASDLQEQDEAAIRRSRAGGM